MGLLLSVLLGLLWLRWRRVHVLLLGLLRCRLSKYQLLLLSLHLCLLLLELLVLRLELLVLLLLLNVLRPRRCGMSRAVRGFVGLLETFMLTACEQCKSNRAVVT